MAVARVFSIPTLLEKILDHLPARRVLLMKRIDSSFKHFIENTMAIKKKLFLAPDASIDDPPIINHMVMRHMTGKCAMLMHYPEESLAQHSYRDMYISQPPISAITVSYEDAGLGLPGQQVVQSMGGITIGVMAEEIARFRHERGIPDGSIRARPQAVFGQKISSIKEDCERGSACLWEDGFGGVFCRCGHGMPEFESWVSPP